PERKLAVRDASLCVGVFRTSTSVLVSRPSEQATERVVGAMTELSSKRRRPGAGSPWCRNVRRWPSQPSSTERPLVIGGRTRHPRECSSRLLSRLLDAPY